MLKLTEPTPEYDERIQAYRSGFLHPGASMDGGGGLIRYDDTAAWLEHVKEFSDPATVPPGKLPAAQYLAVREEDGKVVGVLQIRRAANEELFCYFGHIGYSVAPEERRKGYATEMLRQALGKCRGFGFRRVLVTCEPWNNGSRGTILKCGGRWESTVYEAERDRYLERYWFDVRG